MVANAAGNINAFWGNIEIEIMLEFLDKYEK